MVKFCKSCGAELAPGAVFCMDCGTKSDGSEQDVKVNAAPIVGDKHEPPKPMNQPPELKVEPGRGSGYANPAPQADYNPHHPPRQGYRQAKQRKYQQTAGQDSTVKMPGFFTYLGYVLLMGFPLLGLIFGFKWGLKKVPAARSNLAKAMIIYNILLSAAIVFLFIWCYGILAEAFDISIKWFWQNKV